MATERRAQLRHGSLRRDQANVQGVISQLDGMVTARDQQVKTAMPDFQADGLSEQ